MTTNIGYHTDPGLSSGKCEKVCGLCRISSPGPARARQEGRLRRNVILPPTRGRKITICPFPRTPAPSVAFVTRFRIADSRFQISESRRLVSVEWQARNRQSAIGSRQSSIDNRKSAIGRQQSSVVNHQPKIVNRPSAIIRISGPPSGPLSWHGVRERSTRPWSRTAARW